MKCTQYELCSQAAKANGFIFGKLRRVGSEISRQTPRKFVGDFTCALGGGPTLALAALPAAYFSAQSPSRYGALYQSVEVSKILLECEFFVSDTKSSATL